MCRPVVPSELWPVLFLMTYLFGTIKADLEKAFRLPDVSVPEESQKQKSAELTDSELSTVLFEHPGI